MNSSCICNDDYYPYQGNCKNCPLGGICKWPNRSETVHDNFQTWITAKAGYWKVPSSWGSIDPDTLIRRCTTEGVCLKNKCKNGQSGILCEGCSEGFVKTYDSGTCITCDSTLLKLTFGATSLFFLFITFVLYMYCLQEKCNGKSRCGYLAIQRLFNILKIIVDYMQIVRPCQHCIPCHYHRRH